MTESELAAFQHELHGLCARFGVFIHRESRRQESPQSPVVKHEIELWARVGVENGEAILVEKRRG